MGSLCSERIHGGFRDSAGATGLFEIRRAEGAELHSTELKELFSWSSANRVPKIGLTTSQPILKQEKGVQDEYGTTRGPQAGSRCGAAEGRGRGAWADASTDQHALVR